MVPRRHTDAVPLLALAALLVSTVGCEGSPHGLEWGFRFETPALRERAAFVRATILEGGCDGDRAVYDAELAVGGPAPTSPGELGPGTYGLLGVARDASCVWFADGCVEVRLPDQADARVEVTLSASAVEEALCAVDRCTDGRCTAVGDAGMGDGGTGDGGRTCTPEVCNANDDDCDGRVDEDFGAGCTPCSAGTANCDGDTGNGCEADLATDAANCGACGSGCGDALCSGGSCACAGDLVLSGTRCISVQNDPRNCGGIGSACGDDEYCTGGVCECRPGLVRSGGSCVEPASDPTHCGSGGATCGGGEVCSGGTCTTSCGAGETECGSACVDTGSSDLHCGGCGRVCEGNKVCLDGECFEYRPGVDVAAGGACTSCPCAGCSGDLGRCCPYGGEIACVKSEPGACP